MERQRKSYTVEEFCEAWNIGPTSFYKYLRRNPEFPLIKLGYRLLIPIDKADKFMEEQAGQSIVV